MKTFNQLFNLGLGLAALILLSQNQELIQYLLYVGITHMLVIGAIAWKSPAPLAPAMVEGLHKAGFLHTLMALAAALIVSAQLFASQNFAASSLGRVLLPMGAALIPHVLGVWSGQVVGSRYFEAAPAIEESIFKKLAEDAEAARDGIRALFKEREQSLREQIASLQLQKRLLDEMYERNTKTFEQAFANLRHMAETAQRASLEIGSSLTVLGMTVKDIAASATKAKKDIDECATQARQSAAALGEAIAVVKDVHKLHDAISRLLQEKLFSSEARI